jgi:polysaccharide deacetylase 2 family uncharacterized protein YibQ
MDKKKQAKGRKGLIKHPRNTGVKKKSFSSPLFSVQVIIILGILLILLVFFFYWIQQRTTSLEIPVLQDITGSHDQDNRPETEPPSVRSSQPESEPETIEVLPRYRAEEPIPRITERAPTNELEPKPMISIPFAGTEGRVPIVIVIDDVGYDIGLLEPFLRIPVPLTYAILPGVAHTRESALLISLYDQEKILHQPMENVLGLDPGPGTLWNTMTDQELRDQLITNIQEIPGIVGMNNHMGSKGTQDRRIMNIVLDLVEELDLIFLDSRTTAQSVVAELFNRRRIPFLERHVFLDNDSTREAILDALLTGLKQASTRGYAVMIGHVWTQELADLLLELYPEILDQGYDFVSLVDLLQIRNNE